MSSRQRKSRTSEGTNFEDRFFDLLQDTVEGMDKSIDRLKDNDADKERRLKRVEDHLFPDTAHSVSDLPPWYRDANLIKLLTLIALAVVIIASIVAGLKGYKIHLT